MPLTMTQEQENELRQRAADAVLGSGSDEWRAAHGLGPRPLTDGELLLPELYATRAELERVTERLKLAEAVCEAWDSRKDEDGDEEDHRVGMRFWTDFCVALDAWRAAR